MIQRRWPLEEHRRTRDPLRLAGPAQRLGLDGGTVHRHPACRQELRELAGSAPYAEHTAGVLRPSSAEPAEYLADLTALGCAVDAWETTYLHVLTGEDPVFTWISATGARPVLQALPDELRETFEADYKERLREAYPELPYGTVLPFRRIFVVGHRDRS